MPIILALFDELGCLTLAVNYFISILLPLVLCGYQRL